jgi:hypothetical protein
MSDLQVPEGATLHQDTSVVAGQVRLERLEYGKFCKYLDGPIEDMAGHRQLGWTPGFPETLLPYCDPTVIGISSGAVADLPADCPHGTLLRPLALPHHPVLPVFCRVRTRSENGEENGRDKVGRHYTLARYIVAPGLNIDPLTFFEAMNKHGLPYDEADDKREDRANLTNSSSLHGLSRDEVQNLSRLSVSDMPLIIKPLVQAFIGGAIVYAASGIPLGITGVVDERTFFELAAALWYALPRELRPFMSAGWGVSAQFSGRLTFAYTGQNSINCALFMPDKAKAGQDCWTAPAQAVVWEKKEQPAAKKFSYSRIEPGRIYAHHVWGNKPDEAPVITSLDVDVKTSGLIRVLPEDYPEFPDLLDSTTVRVFRSPGLWARDEYLIEILNSWLPNGKAADSRRLCLNAQHLTYKENGDEFLDSALKALDDGGINLYGDEVMRRRGDEVMKATFEGKQRYPYINYIRQRESEEAEHVRSAKRARLIAELYQGELADMLRALLTAGKAQCTDDLPKEIQQRLFKRLSHGLAAPDPVNTAKLHAQILLLSPPPPVYQEWMRQRAFDLMLFLIEWLSQHREDVAASVRALVPASTIEALHNFMADRQVQDSDLGALSDLLAEQRGKLIELMARLWVQEQDDMAGRRETLLSWLSRIKVPQLVNEPLLHVWFGQDITGKDVPLLAREVERSAVPPALMRPLADLVLHNWYDFSPYVVGKKEWQEIISWWPPEVALALLRLKITARESPLPIPEKMLFREGELNQHMRNWQSSLAPEPDSSGVAVLLWNWAASSTSLPLNTAPGPTELCLELAHSRLKTELSPTSTDIEIAARLARESGAWRALKAKCKPLWGNATKSWHLRLLLSIFPEENFVPTSQQLGALVYQQKWLREHLKGTKIHPHRLRRFRPATLDFHEVPYPGSDGLRWNDAYSSDLVIWAIFSGAPPQRQAQGSLRHALFAFARAGREQVSSDEQITRMCFKYLSAYRKRADFDLALIKVLLEFLLPMLKRYDASGMEELFESVAEELDNPHPSWERLKLGRAKLSIYFEPELRNLFREVVRHGHRKMVLKTIKFYNKERKR